MVAPADMLLFAAVVRAGSFTAAARQLGVTKQTASERVAKLEAQLGVRLLERTTRRLRLTDAGAGYHERCAAIGAQIDDANLEVRRRQAEPIGLLRVSAPTLYGRRFLAPVIASFLERHPAVRIEVVLADRRVNLIDEGLDLAIRIGGPGDAALVARKLGEGHVYYAASPSFLARHGAPNPTELRATRCIGIRPFETWELDGVVTRIEPVLVVNDLEVACEAAIAGVGVAQLPALVCRDAVASGRLQVLFGPEPALERAVYAVYPSRQYLPAKVRLFIDALAAMVEPMRPLELPSSTPPRARAKRTATAAALRRVVGSSVATGTNSPTTATTPARRVTERADPGGAAPGRRRRA
jgi:DNA-binding transcriptional LysR family regulator